MRAIFFALTLSGLLTGCAAKLPSDLESISDDRSAVKFFYENFSRTGLFVRSDEALFVYSGVPVVDQGYENIPKFNELARFYCNARDGKIPPAPTKLLDDDTPFRVCQDEKGKPIFFYFSGVRMSYTDRASYLVAEKRPQISEGEFESYLKEKGYFTKFLYWQ